MKSFLRLSLILLLLLASRHPAFCDDTNHNFAVWEKAISAYERMDATNPPPKGALLFIGASSIGHWKTLARDFPGQPVVNRGFGGSGIADSTHFADRIIVPYAPRMVFLRAGGNDLWAGKSPEEVCADFKEFAETVHAKLPEAEIIYISQSPSLARWKQHEKEKALNALVADYIQGKSYLKYIETYDMVLGADGQPRADLFIADHLHFNDAGNKLMAERVRPYLPK
jgi:lysophospholipase L1-like esterase